ncbi:MAG: hypothetical protein FWG78_02020 [Coriobacteriia bacterium]|nr:hypothetical protein [Coriobacteriia bacterium]
MSFDFTLNKYDINLIWKFRRRAYADDYFGSVGGYWLRFFGMIALVISSATIYVYGFILGGTLPQASGIVSIFIFFCLVAAVVIGWFVIQIIKNSANRQSKRTILDSYQTPFHVTASSDGISVKRGAEDMRGITWEDIFSYQWYKHLLFIEYDEYYNYLVIPESAFASEEQKEYLWCLLEENVEEA